MIAPHIPSVSGVSYYIDQIGFALQFLIASAVAVPALALVYWKRISLFISTLLNKRKHGKRD